MVDLYSKPKASHILSQEDRERCMEKIRWCMEIAKKKWPDKEFPMPDVYFDVKNTNGGMAYFHQWMLRFNIILFAENVDHFIETTVVHECAHLICDRVHGLTKIDANGKLKRIGAHGKEWKSVMTFFEVPAKRCHSYDISSVSRPKKKRAKAGTIISGDGDGGAAEIIFMRRRVENCFKRLPLDQKRDFKNWLLTQMEEYENV